MYSNTEYIDFTNIQLVESIMKDKNNEAVIISSPTSTHYDIIKLCLKYNKHIFIKKPIVNDYDNISEFFNLAEQQNLTLYVSYNRRYDPKIMDISKSLNDIGLGYKGK